MNQKNVLFLIITMLLISMFAFSYEEGLAYVEAIGKGASQALSYLKSRQNPDGGFSEPGESSDLILTCWVLVAGSTAGEKPSIWASGGQTAETFISRHVSEATALIDIEMIVLALSSSGEDARDVEGKNMVSILKAHIGKDGRIGSNIKEHCWGMIALRACGESINAKSIEWLYSRQREDGGWADQEEQLVSDTALAVEALVATGEADSSVVKPSMELLRGKMRNDGGFPGAQDRSETAITAQVVRAIYAVGDDPASPAWTKEGNNPYKYLSTVQSQDGHYFYAPQIESQPALTTAMTVPSVFGKHLPLGVKSIHAPLEASDVTAIDDFGMAGASMRPSENLNVSEESENEFEGLRVEASGRRISWFSDFWLFIFTLSGYFIVVLLTLLVLRLSQRKKRPLT